MSVRFSLEHQVTIGKVRFYTFRLCESRRSGTKQSEKYQEDRFAPSRPGGGALAKTNINPFTQTKIQVASNNYYIINSMNTD